MVKIIKSLAIIAFVAAIAVGATSSYFSDTETSAGNTMKAGSLDLTLNDQNGGTAGAVVTIADMKPSQVRYSDMIKLTVTDNPGKLYKHIVKPTNGILCETVNVTEPECTDQGGTWGLLDENGIIGCNFPQGTRDKNYLPEITWFDLEVWVGPGTPSQSAPICDTNLTQNCWKIIIPDGKVTVENIASKMIYLGTYGTEMVTNTVTIRQSFHMDANAGNEYQSDKCTFNEEFTVLQTNAPDPAGVVNVDEKGLNDPVCHDGIDNDFDGLVDANDPGCTS